MTSLFSYPLSRVVFDETIYPRASHDDQTVTEYAEALSEGAVFPPVILEVGTNRLLDGRHRWLAHAKAGLAEIDVEYREVPPGVPARVFAAELSMRHGLKISAEDRRLVVRAEYERGDEQLLKVIAKRWNVTNSTVTGYVGDLREARLRVRRAQSVLLNAGVVHGGPGWTQQQIADKWDIAQKNVSEDIRNFTSEISYMSESDASNLLLSAAESLDVVVPDLNAVIKTPGTDGEEWFERAVRSIAALADDDTAKLDYARGVAKRAVRKSMRDGNELLRKIAQTGQPPLSWSLCGRDPVSIVTEDADGRKHYEQVALNALRQGDCRRAAIYKRNKADKKLKAEYRASDGLDVIATAIESVGGENFGDWARAIHGDSNDDAEAVA